MADDPVQTVLRRTLYLNMLVAVSKIIVGLLSGALAITADGFHSMVDGTANIIGLFARRVAAQPPDDEHPYGHQRYETLAALFIGVMLAVAAWEVVTGLIDRVLAGGEAPSLTPLTFAVLILTLGVNIFVSRYETRVGRELNAEILLADAKNTGADVYVTLSVLGSMLITAATGWGWVDVVAASVVCVLITKAAWEILQQTGRVLADTAPFAPERLLQSVGVLPKGFKVARVRSRGTTQAAHVDVDVHVQPFITARHTAAVTETIRQRLQNDVGPLEEVEVHFEPVQTPAPDYPLMVRAVADQLGLNTHEVAITTTPEEVTLEMHVEVPGGQSLDHAHAQVSLLEQQLHEVCPEIDTVLTHIEPVRVDNAPLASAESRDDLDEMGEQALDLLRERFPEVGWHRLRVYRCGGHLAMNMHAALAAHVSVEQAHALAEQAEVILRGTLPDLQRVTIHTEPFEFAPE